MQSKDRINNNGYDYADLGLPSGTLWAKMNVGANKPTDYGLYFQWGDTIGYTEEQVGKVKQFNWSDYKWSIESSDTNFSKYTSNGDILDLEDDAAHANMGGEWHMPTPTQISELINTANTTSTWTTQDGVNGILFTSIYNEKEIFFPAAGDAWKGSVDDSGGSGSVWSSELYMSGLRSGKSLDFYIGLSLLSSACRGVGFSVRGVIG